MKDSKKTVSIPEELYEKINARISTTGFKSVDEYVAFALEQIVSEQRSREKLNDTDEAEIKKRLRSLGYLDGARDK